MGWKITALIINSEKDINQEELLEAIGYHNLTKIASKPFEEAMLPQDNEVYIAKYQGNWIICEQDLPIKSFEENTSDEEKIIANYFPDTEICSIALQSTVNFWGYSVSKNNKKLRVRAGASEQGTFIDIGNPLEEEKNLLSKSKIDEDGNRTYIFEDFPDEPLSEDQVGENFVFELCTRYFGEQLDADDKLFETNFEGYRFSKTKQNIASPLETLKEAKPNTKWLKYLLIVIIIIIIRVLLKNL